MNQVHFEGVIDPNARFHQGQNWHEVVQASASSKYSDTAMPSRPRSAPIRSHVGNSNHTARGRSPSPFPFVLASPRSTRRVVRQRSPLVINITPRQAKPSEGTNVQPNDGYELHMGLQKPAILALDLPSELAKTRETKSCQSATRAHSGVQAHCPNVEPKSPSTQSTDAVTRETVHRAECGHSQVPASPKMKPKSLAPSNKALPCKVSETRVTRFSQPMNVAHVSITTPLPSNACDDVDADYVELTEPRESEPAEAKKPRCILGGINTKHGFMLFLILGVACVAYAERKQLSMFYTLAIHLWNRFVMWMCSLGWVAALLFLVSVFLFMLILLPSWFLFLVAGAVFEPHFGILAGTILGTVSCFLGLYLGCLVAFQIGRSILKPLLEEKFLQFESWRIINLIIEEDGWTFAFVMRLSPILPVEPFNYACSLTSMTLRHQAVASLGSFPAVVFQVWIGASAASVASGTTPRSGSSLYITIGVNTIVLLLMGLLIWSATHKYNRYAFEGSNGDRHNNSATSETRKVGNVVELNALLRASRRKSLNVLVTSTKERLTHAPIGDMGRKIKRRFTEFKAPLSDVGNEIQRRLSMSGAGANREHLRRPRVTFT